jgi:spore maturation protein CgeB
MGLRANGVEVIEGRLTEAMEWQTMLYEAGQAQGIVQPGPINITTFASPYIVQHAIASEPDVVIAVSAHNFNIASARTLKAAGLRTAVLMTESPYFAQFELIMASAYDVVFTNERKCATGNYFNHKNVHYLPHAYNPAVHTPDGARGTPSDVLFIGSLFPERKDLIGGVDWTGINFVRRGYAPGQVEQDIVENEEAATLYRAARINLNHHRTTMDFGSGRYIAADVAESLNPRAYELAACGAFQIMDDSRPEARDVFGESLVTYRAGDSLDLERQLRKWLRQPDMRAEWAAAQHEAVLPHSWTARAAQVLECIV